MSHNRITHYDGLYGEHNARPDSDYIFSELLETRSATFDWVVKPHLHTRLYQLFFLKTGKVTFQDATGVLLLDTPCLLFIPPSALHGLEYSPDTTGHILTIADSLVESLFSVSTPVQITLSRIHRIEQATDSQAFTELLRIFERLDEEIFGQAPEYRLMIRAHLSGLWIQLYRLIKDRHDIVNRDQSPSLTHFRHFQKLIKQATYPKSIPDFADELNISAVHLNRICQSVVGKSALDLIQEHQIEEAKKYLRYTSYSISEIAFLLKFEYPNYFAKLFRKITGMSPKAFRENQLAEPA